MTLKEALSRHVTVVLKDKKYQVASDGKLILLSVPYPIEVALTRRQLMSDEWRPGNMIGENAYKKLLSILG